MTVHSSNKIGKKSILLKKTIIESNVNCKSEEEIYFYNLGELSENVSNRMVGLPQDEIHILLSVGE